MAGYIAVDLDGTLAHYDGWKDGEIGPPVPQMLARVQAWLESGVEVRIFTARVAVCDTYSEVSGESATESFAAEQRAKIEAWCEEHVGRALPVTAQKDFACIELYDDRAVAVEPNTGRTFRFER